MNKNKFYKIITGILILVCFAGGVSGQQVLVKDAKKKELINLSAQLKNQYLSTHKKALMLAKIHRWPVFRKTKNGGILSLQGVNSLGFPVYLSTNDNIIAAATTSTNTVQPGGLLGLNLSGSGAGLENKLAIWDGGSVYKIHQEFAGKTIILHDTAQAAEHSTHVAGTMIAKGVNAPAKGMAFNASTLHSYDFDNDVAEISAAAPNLLLSNHSYGDIAGWYFDDINGHWDWYGLPGDSEDYNFGFYNQRTQKFDQIAYSAPYYLIVESAGNNRAYTGPAVGVDYYGFNSSTDPTLVDKGPRPANISSNNGYDVISTTGNAKNILTVGAVNPLPNGPLNSKDISIAYFSSWGPTDDGRVKPDIVGDGVDVLSTGSKGPKDYVILSGTSMAAPNVTGSLYLLQEYYAQKHGGNFMRAATLKGLACHTAVDAGNPGPDYIYGWGLLDTKLAAQAITDNGTKSLIDENTLKQGDQQKFTVVASGDGPLVASITWTDPPGTPTPDGTINSRTPKLINDLDIRVSDGTTTFSPWVLDPSSPAAAAKKGDNVIDNVEQVFIPGAVFDKVYTITVSHKGTLRSGSQDYSLVVTGIGGTQHCASSPSSDADSRIDNVKLSDLDNTPPAGCTTYSDYTKLTAQLAQGKTYPLSITIGTCGANFDKAAKVYIDWNGNGIFDKNELVATTNIINATGTYKTNITVPATVIPGNSSLMRIVLTETADTSVIQPCDQYAKGETQDYRVNFTVDSAKATLIFASAATGAITGCEGTVATNPSIQQFKVSGQNLTQNITATAPLGFEISLNPGSGYGNSLTLLQTGGAVNSTIIYVRSATSAPAGNISGNILLTSSGQTQNVAVTGIITAAPTIKPVPDQGPYANGALTKAINFEGNADTYQWTNDTPRIGLPAGGSGNIPSFIAINAGDAPVTATITVTPSPYSFAYIGNFFSNDVSVINTTTDSQVTTIPVGKSPWGTAASADGKWVYISNQVGNSVSVINTKTNKVIATIDVGLSPEGICVSPDGSKVYVASLESNAVYVISTATNKVTSTIAVGGNATGICISPDGSRVYLTNSFSNSNLPSNSVWVINTANNKVITTIPVGTHPFGICVSFDGSRVYVVNSDSQTVSVINTSNNKVVSVIPVDNEPGPICISPDGSKVYVSNTLSNTISIINTANITVSTIKSNPGPGGLSLSQDGAQLYVANAFDNSFSIYNTATNDLISTISVGSFPFSLGNFSSKGSGCTGEPIKFTITVNPTSTTNPTIVAGVAAGNISACTSTASATPYIQHFTVSAHDLTQDIVATAPSGFEVSLSATSGYGNSVIITQSGGIVSNVIVYVRSATSAPAGNISGNVVLTSTGATDKTVAVAGVVSAQINPSVTITASSNNICTATSVTFTATPQNGGSSPAYQWRLNGNPAGTNDATFIGNNLANGDVVSCVMTSNAACIIQTSAASNSITINVSAPQTPSLSIAASSNNICTGTPVTFTATPVNGGDTPVYQWLLNGNLTGANNAVFNTSALTDGDVVSCIMTSNAACAIPLDATSNSLTMNINPLPIVSAGGSKTITAGNSIVLNGIAPGNISDITWSPATGLSNNKILNPVASPLSTITYTLTVKTTGGCFAFDDVKIVVLVPDIIIPNTFTPNGDRINDTWNIKYLDSYPYCTVNVFDRSGQLVYSSIGYGTSWDGTYKGSTLPTGTYYYVINLKNNSRSLSGFVAIIR